MAKLKKEILWHNSWVPYENMLREPSAQRKIPQTEEPDGLRSMGLKELDMTKAT